MAKVVPISDTKCVVLEARNIGFVKAAIDIVDNELNGVEALCEGMIVDAKKALPEGFEAVSVEVSPSKDGKDFLVVLTGEKRA
ncbi:hypothetical protein E0765_07320 [Sulfuricurvum sp. IAE1]|uniref:hypothetical protein n=1 Tax=Sulfuricurvum sp. IAE1 TaxID=2546102 RepID=UPI0010534A52|nr:hypothetical protein [Sulfuricurvum sp. IAE1]TDA63637.1 hypothetical protein E0765_07320 [Sulfuricurvum sp. IAE1]